MCLASFSYSPFLFFSPSNLKTNHRNAFSIINSFLDDVDRIATHDYEPSDDDIVRARLRTMGVQEYRFMFKQGAPFKLVSHDWIKHI